MQHYPQADQGCRKCDLRCVNAGAKALFRSSKPGQIMAIRVAAVVVAAGRGTRAGLDYPKQYKVLGGSPMVRESLRVFTDHPEVDLVLPVIHPDDAARFAAAAEGLRLAKPVPGAATRQGSVQRRARGARRRRARRSCWCTMPRGRSPRRRWSSRAIAAARASGAAVPGTAGHRHGKARRRRGTRRRDAQPRGAAHRADAAGVRATLRCSTRTAAPRPRRPRGFSRRCGTGRMGGIEGDGIRRRARQHEDDHAGGFRPHRARRAGGARRYPHRHRLRHPCVRSAAATMCGSAA